MAIDPRYITSVDLEPYFVDKSTGAPLANGIVSFWQDDSRTTPKTVYQLSGAPPNYSYTALPNPIILSNTGTFQNANGDNIAVYYYPYDADGADQLYYITVTDSLGTEQFTREAWPNTDPNANPNITQTNIGNEISNPQFVDVLFNTSIPWVISVTGPTVSVTVAPNWALTITSSGVGTVTIARNTITGIAAYPYNPPYTLTVTPTGLITGLTLTQRLLNNPDIWSPASGATNGYVAASILLAPNSAVAMQYHPSTGAAQTMLTANNLTGQYAEFRNTVQLAPATNTDNSDVGYVNIDINLQANAATTLSNIQVLGLETNKQNVVYDQTPANRQRDFLAHYYIPRVAFMPIPSLLIGWDFSLNPAQEFGTTVGTKAVGANKSLYIWDQTIVFQKANSSFTTAAGTSGELVLTATATTQLAIIQYISTGLVTKSLLIDSLCSMVEAYASVAGIPITVSLWVTTDASLPNIAAGTNNSLVATLDSNGKPATFNGNWSEIKRGLLNDATFYTKTSKDYYPFSEWQNTNAGTPTYVAIVIGTGQLTNGQSVSFQSATLQAGFVPTTPGAMSLAQVLHQCQAFYEMSFDVGVVPANNIGVDTGEFLTSQTLGAAAANQLMGTIMYKASKNKDPHLIQTYNPAANNAQARNETTGADCSAILQLQNSLNSFAFTCTTAGGSAVGNILGLHWTADARLGF